MSNFQRNLKHIMSSRGIDTSTLSKEAGFPIDTAKGWLKPARSRSEPRASDLVKLAAYLNVSPKELLEGNVEEDPSKFALPATEEAFRSTVGILRGNAFPKIGQERLDAFELLRWWWNDTNGFWRNPEVLEYVDVYQDPLITERPTVIRVGAKSLACRTLGTESPEMLQKVIDGLTGRSMERFKNDYVASRNEGPKLSIEEINVLNPITGEKIDYAYARILVPVLSLGGEIRIINYSRELS